MGTAEVMIVLIGFNPWLLENDYQQRDLVQESSPRQDVERVEPPSSMKEVSTSDPEFVGADG